MTTQEGVQAEEDAKAVHEYFQQMLEQYPQGFRINKSSIKERFDIPATRSVKVWQKLRRMGHTNEHRTIHVMPSAEKKQEVAQKAQQAEEDDSLEGILNDE